MYEIRIYDGRRLVQVVKSGTSFWAATREAARMERRGERVTEIIWVARSAK